MAIILEGPDAAGKTTLGRQLVGLGMKLVVAGGAPRTPETVAQYCEEQLQACDELHNVIDRITPISHPIYNPNYRQSVMLQNYRIMMLTRPDVILVYCRPPTEALMRPEKHQWKDYDTEEDKQKILNNQMVYIDLYDEMLHATPHICYDYTLAEHDETVELVAMLAASALNGMIMKKLKLLQGVMHACY